MYGKIKAETEFVAAGFKTAVSPHVIFYLNLWLPIKNYFGAISKINDTR